MSKEHEATISRLQEDLEVCTSELDEERESIKELEGKNEGFEIRIEELETALENILADVNLVL